MMAGILNKVKAVVKGVVLFILRFPLFVIQRIPEIVQWAILPAKYFARNRYASKANAKIEKFAQRAK